MNELVKNQLDTSSNMPSVVDPEIDSMLKAGVHLGHSRSKGHPSMLPNIFGVRNGISIIDLLKTQEQLNKASEMVKSIAARRGLVLLVGTRPSAKKLIMEMAEKLKMPYLTERWIGGALTNFKIVAKRVEYMESLEKEKATGGFEKYTKKERLIKDEEIRKLNKMFHGLRLMKKLPEAVFIVNVVEDAIAAKEAKKIKIPVIGLVDTNSDCRLVDLGIPSNDDSLPALNHMLGKIEKAIEEGRKTSVEVAVAKPSEN